jgi:hypothetical protein
MFKEYRIEIALVAGLLTVVNLYTGHELIAIVTGAASILNYLSAKAGV